MKIKREDEVKEDRQKKQLSCFSPLFFHRSPSPLSLSLSYSEEGCAQKSYLVPDPQQLLGFCWNTIVLDPVLPSHSTLLAFFSMFLRLFSKTMEEDKSNSSRNRTQPPLQQIRTDMGSLYSADLTSYNSACKEDPDLQSFDSSLHQRTNRVINSLASGAESRSLSFEALIEVSGCLLEMNQEVVRFIIESREDVWDNKDLTCLVNAYFDSSIKTLDFCNAVDNCVKRARIGQMIIQFAVKQFEMESKNTSAEPGGANKYAKTLEELNKFKASGDPFDGDFFMLFESVYEQQVMLLEILHKQKRKLDKKLKNIKHWKKISNVVFVTAFVSVLIFSVVAAAIAAPPVVTAVAAALAVPIGSVGKWCSHLWKKYETAVRRQKDVVLSMKVGAYITMKDMENIRVHVDKLKVEMESMMQRVDFATKEGEDEVAVRFAMQEISKRFDVFTERIEEVGVNAAKCSKDITLARTIVLRHILSFPTSSDSEQGNLIEAITL